MDENMRVSGSGLLVVMRKFPLSSVKVPASVPLISTDTEGTISLVVAFFTFPESEVWEKTDVATSTKNNNTVEVNR